MPWLEEPFPPGASALIRWNRDRLRNPPPPNPPPGAIPTEEPRPARPRVPDGETRVTWIGHATFLIQLGGLNVLTDPVFSERATPISWLGPRRLLPPSLGIDELPPIDVVLLSHSHYDHLDAPSVDRLRDRFGDGLRWVTPLGYREWFAGRHIRGVVELDWWDGVSVGGPRGAGVGASEGAAYHGDDVPSTEHIRITACPAQHWCRRGFRTNERLWASFVLRASDGRSVYFGGDSGYFEGYRDIGARHGSFDVTILPIGAYEPRWFMETSHKKPEDAVQAYRDLGSRGGFIGMHWGTFRLTDEDVLEPPIRTRAAWAAAGLPEDDLHLPGVGGTVVVDPVAKGPE